MLILFLPTVASCDSILTDSVTGYGLYFTLYIVTKRIVTLDKGETREQVSLEFLKIDLDSSKQTTFYRLPK